MVKHNRKTSLNQQVRLPPDFPTGRAENPIHWSAITWRRVRGLQKSPKDPKMPKTTNQKVNVFLKYLENNPLYSVSTLK